MNLTPIGALFVDNRGAGGDEKTGVFAWKRVFLPGM
jgi:hypothetical protein